MKSHLINIFLDENESNRIIKTNIRINRNIIQKLVENNDLSLENGIIILSGLMMRKCCRINELKELDPIKIAGGANIRASTFLTRKSKKSLMIIYKYRFLYVFRRTWLLANNFSWCGFCMP